MPGVVIGELQSLRRHPVEVRRFHDLLAVTTEVPVSEVIGHDVDDIRRTIAGTKAGRPGEGKCKENQGKEAWEHPTILGKITSRVNGRECRSWLANPGGEP